MNTAMDDGRNESPGEQTLSFRPVTDEDLDKAPTDDAQDTAAGGAAARDTPEGGAARDVSEGEAARDVPESGATQDVLEDGAVLRDAPEDGDVSRDVPEDGAVARDAPEGSESPPFEAAPAREPSLFEERPVREPSIFEGTPARRPSLFEKPAALRRPPEGEGPQPGLRARPGFDEPPSGRPSMFVRPAALGGPGATPPADAGGPVTGGHEPVEGDDEPARDSAGKPVRDEAAATSDPADSPQPEATGSDVLWTAEEPEPGAEPVAEDSLEAEPEPEPGPEFEPELAAEASSEREPQPDNQPEPEAAADRDAVADNADTISAETGSEPEAAAESPSPESRITDSETAGSDAAADADAARTEAAAATDADARTDADTDADTDAEIGAEAGTDAGPEAEATATTPGSEAESEPGPGERLEELPAEAAEALMEALGSLRESVADLRFALDLPGSEEAQQAQADLLAQLENYVLPRVRTRTAPALIVIAGSTGAGKSTLVNSLAEKNVSRTGIRRPTTGTPVLVCHPEDYDWFARGELLSGLERLDRLSPESGTRSLVISATEKLPQGVALLDTPDIDSVVEEHHDVAHRMLDAADLWIFVTTAARYADAPAWKLLRLAKERGARLAIVLSRVQQKSADVVLKHFVRMLTEYGLGDIDRFVIHESTVADGKLPDSEVTDLRLWLAELSVDEKQRAQAVRETLNGVLNSFRTRVPALARHLEAHVAFRAELRGDVEAAFLGALGEIEKSSKNGSLLHGEVLARWQDFAGSGDLVRSLQLRKRGRAAKQAPERVLAFKGAIRTGLESVIVAAANRACEEVVARWSHRSELGAKLGKDLDRPSDNLVRHTGRAIASWQDHLGELVRTEGVAKRSVSKLVSFDPDSLALIFMVAMFSGNNGEGVPHRLVNAVLGAESLRGIGAKALSDLKARIGMLFDEEAMRYVQALDSAGIPDESVATRLYQATYNLEVAR
ncbi:dynamin family protein [Nonomuraea sp. NPDC050404]|uniref:dynamin family protein n=1 Tax=Nonomuraea sp. NPDC050404 TaxID=3155783 RepID=UPI0033FA759D